MTHQEHQTYLKLAFQTVGYSFTDELIETIILTTQAVNKKKGKFTLMDAAIIRAAINAKYHPVLIDKAEFEELERMEENRE